MTDAVADGTIPLLSVRGLRSWFEAPTGLMRAVEDVSFHVNESERVGVVGESGSGKTQAFFALFGLAHGYPGVVTGEARLGAIDLLAGLEEHVTIEPAVDAPAPVVHKALSQWARLQRRRLEGVMGREVAILFQDPRRSLIPYWTVGRHLEEGLVRRGEGSPAAWRERAKELLVRLGFDDPARILASYPEQLSGGQAQRALLALTLSMAPRLLVADEPTTGLDAINQRKALAQLQQVQSEEGLALVLISHDLSVVELMVDRVIVMFAGRVLESAPVRLLADDRWGTSHPYTRTLRESQRRRAAGAAIAAVSGAPDAVPRRGVGCPYAVRCGLRPSLSPAVQARCASEFPPPVEIQPGHFLSCWGEAT